MVCSSLSGGAGRSRGLSRGGRSGLAGRTRRSRSLLRAVAGNTVRWNNTANHNVHSVNVYCAVTAGKVCLGADSGGLNSGLLG